jgi:hypothetical protein
MRFWIMVHEISTPTSMAIAVSAPERSLGIFIPASPSNTILPGPPLPMMGGNRIMRAGYRGAAIGERREDARSIRARDRSGEAYPLALQRMVPSPSSRNR